MCESTALGLVSLEVNLSPPLKMEEVRNLGAGVKKNCWVEGVAGGGEVRRVDEKGLKRIGMQDDEGVDGVE